jgi:hypothetical protein
MENLRLSDLMIFMIGKEVKAEFLRTSWEVRCLSRRKIISRTAPRLTHAVEELMSAVMNEEHE